MAIELKHGRYYIGLWYFDLLRARAPQGGNFMACLWREDRDPTQWILDARLRFYCGPRPHEPFNHPDHPDRNCDDSRWQRHTWSCASPAESERVAHATLQRLAPQIGCTPLDFFPVRGNVDTFFQLICAGTKLPEWLCIKVKEIVPDDGHCA